jgi:hypothetical protein
MYQLDARRLYGMAYLVTKSRDISDPDFLILMWYAWVSSYQKVVEQTHIIGAVHCWII